MDYEKAYKEALERAREIKSKILSSHLSTESCKAVSEYIDTIIPELRESEIEDERIIKGLIKLLTVASEVYLVDSTGIKKDYYLAYLEKQKESLHIQETCKENADFFTDEDERIRKWLVDYFKAVERCWIHWDISPERIVSYLEKQKENPKTADSIPSDCTLDAKCKDRWHKVGDSLPDNGRLVLANDCLGNINCKGGGIEMRKPCTDCPHNEKTTIPAKDGYRQSVCHSCRLGLNRNDGAYLGYYEKIKKCTAYAEYLAWQRERRKKKNDSTRTNQ